ncbi:MAG: heme ABC exporter ATP-binding protein CcmA [Hyphomonadaceae bacterium]|nr:heme ABC exporter ATP-binding protein CcmA [Hyphomonadaceae bacterium]
MRVDVESLAIERGELRLFENLSFTAAPGAHVALTGANGTGKTSLLRALAGFLAPSAGTIRFSIEEPAAQTHFLGHRDGLKGALEVREHLMFWRDLFGGADDPAEALARVGLTRVADLPARALSAGQSRRLSLARLLVAERPLWLLDEPAAGLDTAGKALLADLIAAHRMTGGVVIAAVHEPLGAPDVDVRLGA